MALKTIDYCLLQDTSHVGDFLREQFDCSSNKLKKFFDKSFLLRSFKKGSTLKLPLNFVNDGFINPHYEGPAIEILAENELFLVLNKHPNQFVHPLSYDESDNCLSYLRAKRPELLFVNQSNYDRGLLYRLDYETSGVLIYVKQESLYKKLREEFNEVAKKKIYRCWVNGECSLQGRFIHSFSSSGEKGQKVVVHSHVDDETAGTLSVSPLRFDSDKNQTLMEVQLKTGLRHQIRAQMAYLGYPLVGDELYGGTKASRLYLHAVQYEIEVEGRVYNYESKSNDFQ